MNVVVVFDVYAHVPVKTMPEHGNPGPENDSYECEYLPI